MTTLATILLIAGALTLLAATISIVRDDFAALIEWALPLPVRGVSDEN